MNKAIILDRDGVINKDEGYVCRSEDFVFKEGVFEFCKYAQEKGYKLIIATNQSGIARGYFTEEDYAKVNNYMLSRFSERGITIDKVYYCPYHQCAHEKYKQYEYDRKPNPGMFLKAIEDFSLMPEKSFAVGDKKSDIDAALQSGIKNIYCIKTKYEVHPDAIRINDLRDIAKDIGSVK